MAVPKVQSDNKLYLANSFVHDGLIYFASMTA